MLVFLGQKETTKGVGQAFYPSILVRYINFQDNFSVIEDTLFHHLKQILYTFFSFLHKWSSMVYIFILFQLILLKPIISNFRCLFFHGKKEKKKPLKELIKHSILQSLLDISTSKSSFLVVEDAFLHHLRQMLSTFFSFLH